MLVAGCLWIYKRSKLRATSAAHAHSHHFRRRPAERAHMVTRRPIHRLQFGPRWEVRYLGAAGQRRRSCTDHQGTGAQLAAGLVARWQIHRVSFRRRRGRNVRCPRSGRCGIERKICVFRILPSLVAGQLADVVPRISHVDQFRTFTFVVDLTVAHPARVLADLATAEHVRDFSRLAPRWQESLVLGWESGAEPQLLDSARYRRGSQFDRKLRLKFRNRLEKYQ